MKPLIYVVDPQAMLKLGRAQAAAILAIKQCGLEAVEYFPKVVKNLLLVMAMHHKEQVAFMLKKMVQFQTKSYQMMPPMLSRCWCHMMNNSEFPHFIAKTHQNNKKGDWANFIAQNPDRVRE